MDEEIINQEQIQPSEEDKVIYTKQPIDKPTFAAYFRLCFKLNQVANIISFIFVPAAVALGIFFLIQFPGDAIYSIILFICAGVVFLAVLLLLVIVPIINLKRLKGLSLRQSFFEIHWHYFRFHYEFDGAEPMDFIFAAENVEYGKEYKKRFFIKVRQNGKPTGFFVEKESLTEAALEKLRSFVI